MQRPLQVFLTVTGLFLLYMVWQVRTLLELLVVDGHQDAILRSELPPVGAEIDQVPMTAPTPERIAARSLEARSPRLSTSTSISNDNTTLIPRIIHQTYRTTEIPAVWRSAQASCQALHPAPQWEYKLWTDAAARDFIAAHYPAHLRTFDSYRYPIQRADAIRYYVLDHFGGVYLDLDDGCERSLEPLLRYPAWARKTKPTGISNDALAAVPGHPFFARVVAELPRYDRSWLLPYITVMASTGPLFLSIIWRLYSDDGFNVGDGPDGGRLRILFPAEYGGHPWSFFSHHVGNSWHSYDVRLMFWMLHHWILVTIFGFALGFSLLYLGWSLYRQFLSAATTTSTSSSERGLLARAGDALDPGYRIRYLWKKLSVDRDYELLSRRDD